jgi:hypothetical protein
VITWGLVSALTALVVGVKSYYLARFALGVAEAGFLPGAGLLVMAGILLLTTLLAACLKLVIKVE